MDQLLYASNHDDRDVRVSHIHPTAVVSSLAELGHNVTIGPYCVVEDGAVIGDDCHLAGHVTIKGNTTLGVGNIVSEGAVLGGAPQHLAAGQQCGQLTIGDHNMIRENATLHRAFHEHEVTTVGDHNLIMVNAHVGHDSRVEHHTILANNVMLAGHTTVGHHAYLAGAVGVHQFCRIGHYTMVGGQAALKRDVPPFVTIDGHTNCVVGLNVVGLRRNGFTVDDIGELKRAYRFIYRSGATWSEVRAQLADKFPAQPAADFAAFFAVGKRGFVQERATPRRAIVPGPHLANDDDSDLSVLRAS